MTAKVKIRRESGRTNGSVVPQLDIAWQRVSVVVPSFWSITTVSGDDYSGSVRIERTGEATGAFAPFGIDIRWSGKVKSEQSAEMLDKRIKPLIDAAIKAAKSSGDFSKPDIIRIDDDQHPERGNIREYSWRGRPATMGRIWRCSQCGRLLIAQVQGVDGGKFAYEAEQILSSIACHNNVEGWTRWALFGVDVSVPDTYGLIRHQLMTTYLELRFGKLNKGVASATGELVTLEQWSAANVQLKGVYLDEWIEIKSRMLLSTTKIDKEQSEVNGHSALQMTGMRHGLGFWLEDGIKALRHFSRPATNYSALAWECPESNKVYLVQNMTSKRASSVAREIANRTLCHTNEPGLSS